jgi:hypothetical protein
MRMPLKAMPATDASVRFRREKLCIVALFFRAFLDSE